MTIGNAAAYAELLDALTGIAARAALAIRDQAGKSEARRKADGSPVTAADLLADAVIREELARLAPALPIVSEEAAERTTSVIDGNETYFLVDPLDGTREFVAGRDEYAINIALMKGGTPFLGVIAAPALGAIWRGTVGRGADQATFAQDGRISPPRLIRTRKRPQRDMTVLVSRSHLDSRTEAYLRGLLQPRTIACGSAIKFCRVAEGTADLYPRLAPTRDWDVAAGHAIIAAAGGCVLDPSGSQLRYGTAERRIPAFIAAGDPENS